jgi:hypothetical protein
VLSGIAEEEQTRAAEAQKDVIARGARRFRSHDPRTQRPRRQDVQLPVTHGRG